MIVQLYSFVRVCKIYMYKTIGNRIYAKRCNDWMMIKRNRDKI